MTDQKAKIFNHQLEILDACEKYGIIMREVHESGLSYTIYQLEEKVAIYLEESTVFKSFSYFVGVVNRHLVCYFGNNFDLCEDACETLLKDTINAVNAEYEKAESAIRDTDEYSLDKALEEKSLEMKNILEGDLSYPVENEFNGDLTGFDEELGINPKKKKRVLN